MGVPGESRGTTGAASRVRAGAGVRRATSAGPPMVLGPKRSDSPSGADAAVKDAHALPSFAPPGVWAASPWPWP